MKCDELKAYKGDMTIPVYGTIADAQVYLKEDADTAIATLRVANEEKTERIAELKTIINELEIAKHSAQIVFQDLLDAHWIRGWWFNGKFNVNLKLDNPENEIAELKQKLEDAKATAYAESVDAGMRERRLRRALYKACANWAKEFRYKIGFAISSMNTKYDYSDADKWQNMERKCRAKAEKFGG